AGLCMVAPWPLHLSDRQADPSAAGFFIAVALSVILVMITFLKKKLFIGTLGVVFPVFALAGAIRLAKPGSVWARWLYDPDRARTDIGPRRRARKLERSRRRFEGRLGRLENWFTDLIGGKPSMPARGPRPLRLPA